MAGARPVRCSELLTVGRICGRPLRRRSRCRVHRSAALREVDRRHGDQRGRRGGAARSPHARCAPRWAPTRSATTCVAKLTAFGVDTSFVGSHPSLPHAVGVRRDDAAGGSGAAVLPPAARRRTCTLAGRRGRRRHARPRSRCCGSPGRRWRRSRHARRSRRAARRPRPAASHRARPRLPRHALARRERPRLGSSARPSTTCTVAVGNRAECGSPSAPDDPDAAARRLLARGVGGGDRQARRRRGARRHPRRSQRRRRRTAWRSCAASARATHSAERSCTGCSPGGSRSACVEYANAAGAIVAVTSAVRGRHADRCRGRSA